VPALELAECISQMEAVRINDVSDNAAVS